MSVFDPILHRLRHGCQTMAYPQGAPPALPDRHGGALRVDAAKCAADCTACVPVCPTDAVDLQGYTDAQIKSMIDGLLEVSCS